MSRLPLRVSELTLLILITVLSSPLSGEGLAFAGQQTDIKTASKTKDDAADRSELMKPIANGNQAMQDAQAIRHQLQTATSDQKPALIVKMKEHYQTAITEYELALEETKVRDENGLQAIGLIGVIRNGLVSKEKAVDMLMQDKDLPVIVSNLGAGLWRHRAISGSYQHARASINAEAGGGHVHGTRNGFGAGGQDARSDCGLRQDSNRGSHSEKYAGSLLQECRHCAHEQREGACRNCSVSEGNTT